MFFSFNLLTDLPTYLPTKLNFDDDYVLINYRGYVVSRQGVCFVE